MTDDEKMAELILYISDRSQLDPPYGAIKLNKILFYADFLHYAKHGRPITGQEYMKLNQGPAPRRLVPVRKRLVAARELIVREVPYGTMRQERPIALRAADLTGFNGEEIAMVDSVISLFWGLSARQVSEISHEFDGWKLADYKETIPYDMALLSDREPTEEDLALAVELGREYAAYTA
ncbi:MAG TPA: Panacea domain-containing protein [Longimicrobium sp.]|jgi:uncharacterized phage-associated protein